MQNICKISLAKFLSFTKLYDQEICNSYGSAYKTIKKLLLQKYTNATLHIKTNFRQMFAYIRYT